MADPNSPKLNSGKLMPSAKPPAPAVTPQPVAETPSATVASETTAPCPKVMAMTHQQKMEAAIEKANLPPEIMEELGDIKEMVAMMVVIGGGLALLAATGYGAIAEAIGLGLLIAGAWVSGSEIGSGINSMVDFYEKTRCDRAQSQQDLADAGKSFADGIAKMGVGGFSLLLTLAGGRKASKAKTRTKPGNTENTGFSGRRGNQLENAPYQKVRNSPTTIGNRQYSGHALDQMQNRGIMPSVVENTIRTGKPFPGNTPGTKGFADPVNKVTVIVNSENGTVVTVIPGG